jgi:hypothetical protein
MDRQNLAQQIFMDPDDAFDRSYSGMFQRLVLGETGKRMG